MNKYMVGGKTRTKLGCACQHKSVHTPTKTRVKLCDSGIGITWMHVSRLPTAAPGQ